MRECTHMRGSRGKDSQEDFLMSMESDMGLDLTTSKSWRVPKSRVQCSTLWTTHTPHLVLLNQFNRGSLGGSVVWHLPSAQGVTPGSRDRVPCWAPCMEPASPSACVSASPSLCLSWINKIFLKKCTFIFTGQSPPLVIHFYKEPSEFMSGGQGVHTTIWSVVCAWTAIVTDKFWRKIGNCSLIIFHTCYLWSDLWTEQLATTSVLYPVMTNILW